MFYQLGQHCVAARVSDPVPLRPSILKTHNIWLEFFREEDVEEGKLTYGMLANAAYVMWYWVMNEEEGESADMSVQIWDGEVGGVGKECVGVVRVTGSGDQVAR